MIYSCFNQKSSVALANTAQAATENVASQGARIVISLDEKGGISNIASFCFGSHDSTLGHTGDAALLQSDIPFLLEELRLQLALGRRLTPEESEPLDARRRQSMVSGSTVTE